MSSNKNLIVKPLSKLGKIVKNKPKINSDHGTIYFSKEYQRSANSKFIISMSRIGNCLDNRPIEYFFSILKSKCISKIPFKERSFEPVKAKIKKFIKYYNEERIQACLGYLALKKYREKYAK